MSLHFKTWTAAAAGCVMGLASSHPARADDGARDCSAVHEAGLAAERAGELRAATELFQQCAVDSCSNPARRSCDARLLRLELDAPSVVPLLADASGEPVVDAEVTMDGTLLSARLDGHAVAVDPGLHEFVFSARGSELGRVRVVVAQGQRNRELWMTAPSPTDAQPTAANDAPTPNPSPLPTPLSASTTEPASEAVADHAAPAPQAAAAAATKVSAIDSKHAHGSVLPYVFGGTTVLGGAAYALLSTWARGDNKQLSRCSPNCSQDSVSHIRTMYVAADISLGVAIAAAVGGITSFLLSGSSSNDRPSHSHDFAWSVQPERSGALANFRGTL